MDDQEDYDYDDCVRLRHALSPRGATPITRPLRFGPTSVFSLLAPSPGVISTHLGCPGPVRQPREFRLLAMVQARDLPAVQCLLDHATLVV